MYDHRVEQSGTGMIVTLMKDELFGHNDAFNICDILLIILPFIKLYYPPVNLIIIIITNDFSDVGSRKIFFE